MLLIQRILNKDMLHHFQLSIDANNASHTYLKIMDFFKGHKHHHNIPTNIVSNRMAAVTTDGEEKICFRFNQGLCKNKNCEYVHKIMTEQQKKDTGYDKDRKDSKDATDTSSIQVEKSLAPSKKQILT